MAHGVVPPSSRPLAHRSGRHVDDGRRPAGRHAVRSEGGLRFVALTALALVPGAGLLAAGRRVLGGILLALTVAAAALGIFVVLGGTARERALDLAVRPDALLVIAAVAAAFGLVWAASIALTGWAARPRRSHRWQRVLGTAFVGLLCLAVLAPSA